MVSGLYFLKGNIRCSYFEQGYLSPSSYVLKMLYICVIEVPFIADLVILGVTYFLNYRKVFDYTLVLKT